MLRDNNNGDIFDEVLEALGNLPYDGDCLCRGPHEVVALHNELRRETNGLSIT
jgi:hypothetical protein